MYNDLPMTDYVYEMVTNLAMDMSLEDVQQAVDKLQGKTGDDAMVWLNISMKKAARDNVVLPAIEVAKLHLGTSGVDADGKAKDASDGRAVEVICADFMSDPNNNPQH
jgi:cell division GTPase FtsZ